MSNRRPRSYQTLPEARGKNARAFTFRRTPKDVDGARHDVPCIVLGKRRLVFRMASGKVKLYGTPKRLSRKWLVVRFNDGTQLQRHASNIYASPLTQDMNGAWSSKPINFVGSHTTSSDLWWQNTEGTLERPATVYEAARHGIGDPPPIEGWTLVDGAAAIEARKWFPIGTTQAESHVERADREARETATQKRRQLRAEHAATMLAHHETKLRRQEKLVKKWKTEKLRANAALTKTADQEKKP